MWWYEEMETKEKKPPRRRAVSLRYIPGKDPAPRITAKGEGLVADKIIELARQYGIPIKEDPALIQILAQLDLNQEIPPSIYIIVAEILAFVYSLHRKWPGHGKSVG
jgi:flagellar biosynthesis protein